VTKDQKKIKIALIPTRLTNIPISELLFFSVIVYRKKDPNINENKLIRIDASSILFRIGLEYGCIDSHNP
jgi:hypothetical protein